MWILFFSALSFAAVKPPEGKQNLVYKNGPLTYTVEHSAAELTLKRAPAQHRIESKPCNQAMLETFWQNVEREFKKLPRAKLASTGSMPAVSLGNKTRHIETRASAENYFERVPKIFLDLVLTEHRECANASSNPQIP